MVLENYMALVENIYFSINLEEKNTDWDAYFSSNLLTEFDALRLRSLKETTHLMDGVEIIKGIQRYPYGFHVQDKFRIYFAHKTGDNYPIYVIVSAQYLHLHNTFNVLDDIQATLKEIIRHFDPTYEFKTYEMKLGRIDICNHNTKINPEKYIRFDEFNSRVVTKIRKVFPVVELIGEYDIKVPYYRYGSGAVAIRFYNKIQEVVEMRYKSFFIPKWLSNNLIDQRTHDIYDNTYKLNRNYHLDFLYSHFIIDKDNIDPSLLEDIKEIYNDYDKTVDDKYDILKRLIKELKIKVVPEVSNCEFQLRHDFLKSLKIIDNQTGEYIDYTNIFELFRNIEQLYNYLTTTTFRVINTKDEKARKRNKETDKIWLELQKSKIRNVNTEYNDDLEFYREYQKNMNKMDSINKALSNMAHLHYINTDEITYSKIAQMDIGEVLEGFVHEYFMNENYHNIKDKLNRQVKYYGKKIGPGEGAE